MTALLTMHDDTALDHVKLIAERQWTLPLLAGRRAGMPPQMFERIKALDSVGVLFCAASGRPSYTLREMFAEVSEHNGDALPITVRGLLQRRARVQDLIDVPTYHDLIDFTAADVARFCHGVRHRLVLRAQVL